MRTAIAQVACTLGDVPANCALIAEHVARARAAGCELVLFPELTDTGYEVGAIRSSAQPRNGLAFMTASKAAAHERVFVACGLSEREDDKIYNSLVVFNREGELVGKYRKTHLFNQAPANEGSCMTAGDSLVVIDINGYQCGLMICYDLRFPEMARALALRGADVILIASAWPFPRVEHWQTLVKARAIENQVYLVAANRVGTDAGCTFCGSSCVVSPYGDVRGAGAPDRSQLVLANLDRETLDWTRAKMPVLTDRRPELYLPSA